MNRILSRQRADPGAPLHQTEPLDVTQANRPKRVAADCLVVWRAQSSELHAAPDKHEIALVSVVGMSTQCQGRSTGVVTKQHGSRRVRLPSNSNTALTHALAHATECSHCPAREPTPSAVSFGRADERALSSIPGTGTSRG